MSTHALERISLYSMDAHLPAVARASLKGLLAAVETVATIRIKLLLDVSSARG